MCSIPNIHKLKAKWNWVWSKNSNVLPWKLRMHIDKILNWDLNVNTKIFRVVFSKNKVSYRFICETQDHLSLGTACSQTAYSDLWDVRSLNFGIRTKSGDSFEIHNPKAGGTGNLRTRVCKKVNLERIPDRFSCLWVKRRSLLREFLY